MKRIYFDYAATTPVIKPVTKAMLSYLDKNFGNPSSLHWWGQTAAKAITESRETIKNILGANSDKEIIFTSSATESNNLAIKGLAFYSYYFRRTKGHFITSSIEHDSVLEIFRHLEDLNIAEVTYLDPGQNGLINPDEVITKIKENTILISFHYVNSETGVIQKIKEISEKIKKVNDKIYLHIDAAQAGFENLNVKFLNVDLITLSSHKIYGPKGIALLYRKENVPLVELISGSGQESGLRGGTEAVPLIVGFAKALEIVSLNREKINKHLAKIRDYLLLKLDKFGGKIMLNSIPEISSTKILNLYFPTKTSQELIIYLDSCGIGVSSGTACQSRALKPSSVITKLFSEERARKSLRFSFGIFNSKRDIDILIGRLKKFL